MCTSRAHSCSYFHINSRERRREWQQCRASAPSQIVERFKCIPSPSPSTHYRENISYKWMMLRQQSRTIQMISTCRKSSTAMDPDEWCPQNERAPLALRSSPCVIHHPTPMENGANHTTPHAIPHVPRQPRGAAGSGGHPGGALPLGAQGSLRDGGV